ncbi:S-adenosyl-L-methionine-dependent methyltransferase [Coniochaeta ligniaria NRRL 30616]|uniref:S-adenosyl-L-methionine-dependent methyltransferase n=1 Tax=Coniochaeta ligniaria NRRL 30616 TaxID=1408157 RepID=A0A1J7J7I2_9PEZI|nr:S-adenosyl-L-methionine-dependent methyltransferase [Coniochaeta ligniaria NRRL 30616]
MSGAPGKEEPMERVATGMNDAARTPIEHPPVEEQRTDEGEQQHEKMKQPPQQDDYQHWVQSQQEAHQHAEPGSSSTGGGRRSPKDRDVGEGSSQDPELSSLSALSNFSTGLSVDSDADSALGDLGSPLSTTSVRSSIYEFVEEHGRTFHRYKQGKYWMPNDMKEQERLDLQHAVFLMLLKGKLHLAPLDNPQEVLDLGTGTGIWAIDFAHQYPSAQVIGTDLSPIQPDFVPANCRFEVDDAEDDWVYPSYHLFDYVHLRLMFHTFRSHRRVIDSALAHLRPGGWMEWQDYYSELQCVDDSMRGTALERWVRLYAEGGARMGRDMLAPRRYRQWMEDAGFVNVVEEKLVIPGNAWPRGRDMKRLGLWQMTNFLDGIHAVTMTIFTKGLGMSPEEVELLLVDVRKDIKNLGVHFYFLTYFVYGQKPPEPKGKATEA